MRSGQIPRRDVILGLLFVLIWLVPTAFVGVCHQPVPGVGNYLNNLYRLSCLFTHRVGSWHHYYIQVRLNDDPRWHVVPTEQFFRLQPFGLRTRLTRILDDATQQPNGVMLVEELKAWIANRHEEMHPDRGEVSDVRFLVYSIRTGPENAAKASAWVRPPLPADYEDNSYVRPLVIHLRQRASGE